MSELIKEAFQELKMINEDTFTFDKEGVLDLSKFLSMDDKISSINVIDPDATTENELAPNYEGKVILRCCVCNQDIYADPADVIVDEETQRVNVGEECPHCYNIGGYKVIGQVQPFVDDEIRATVDGEEVEIGKKEEIIESWDTEEKTYIIRDEDYFEYDNSLKAFKVDSNLITGGEDIGDSLIIHFIDQDSPQGEELIRYDVIDIDKYGAWYLLKDSYNQDIFESLNEDTIKQNGKWVNKGKEGTHGTFTTKKAADAQRKSMFSQGFKGESFLNEKKEKDLWDTIYQELTFSDDQRWSTDDKGKKHNKIHQGYYDYQDQMGIDYEEDGTPVITIKAVSEKDFDKAKEIADRYRDKGVDYITKQDKYNKRFPYQLRIRIPMEESLNEDLDFSTTNRYSTLARIRKEFNYYVSTIEENIPHEMRYKYWDIYLGRGDSLILEWITQESFTQEEAKKFEEKIYDVIKEVEDNLGIDILSNFNVIVQSRAGKDYGYYSTLNESLEDLTRIIVREEDIHHFDDETGDIIITSEVIIAPTEGEHFLLEFDDEEIIPQVFKFIRKTEDGYQFEYIGEGLEESLNEDFTKATVETQESVLSMESDDSGKVTVTSEPRKIEESGDEMIAPLSDEVESEIESNTENDEEEIEIEGEVEEPVDIEIEDIEEEGFDELGESYLTKVYDNVKSFKTIKGSINENKIKIEGIITFNSGKKAKTNFIFEGTEISKRGKVKFLGENIQLAKKKNAFTLQGTIKNHKLMVESLTYNYRAQDNKTNTSIRTYGTVKRK